MATVPFSERLCNEIRTAATAPFIKTMGEVCETIKQDALLRREINRATGASEEEIQLAERLTELNKQWTFKWHNNTCIIAFGHTFDIDASIGMRHTTHTRFDIGKEGKPCHPGVEARFKELAAPWYRALNDKQALENALNAIFQEVPNLNRALQIMPSMINWVPENYRAKLNATPPKRAARRSLDEIKQDAFTPEALAAMARARITTDT